MADAIVAPSLSGGEYTAISWADLTFNGWWGCAKVSPACRFCYADVWAQRWGHDVWGKKTERRLFGDQHWNQPKIWNRRALKIGRPLRVFCGSMKDVFEDHPLLPPQREKLWALIEQTVNLRWMLLTKRPENAARMVPAHWMANGWPGHVWLGVSAETQRFARERIPVMLNLPVRGVRFVSCEPLLELLDLERWLGDEVPVGIFEGIDGWENIDGPGVTWVIAGGGSGKDHRSTREEWLRSLLAQSDATGARFHLKQLGQVLATEWGLPGKGENPVEWPAELRRQDVPDLGELVAVGRG